MTACVLFLPFFDWAISEIGIGSKACSRKSRRYGLRNVSSGRGCRDNQAYKLAFLIPWRFSEAKLLVWEYSRSTELLVDVAESVALMVVSEELVADLSRREASAVRVLDGDVIGSVLEL